MEFYFSRIVKLSKKPHQCFVCNSIISAGSRYVRESGKYQGEFFSRCSCISCYSHVTEHLRASGENEFDIDGIVEDVQERFCLHCDHRETCMLHCLHCDTVIHAGEEMFSGQLGESHE